MYDIDLDLLRCFVVIAQTKNFTLAGEKLNKSQSAISMRIKSLEEKLSTQLLHRTSRQVELTHEGQNLLPMAKKLLSEGEKLVSHMTQPMFQGKIRIGLLEYIAPHRVSEIIEAIQAQLPEMDITFRIGLSSQLNDDVQNRLLDIAFSIITKSTEDSIFLFEDPLVWVSSQVHSVDVRDKINLCLMKDPCYYRREALRLIEQSRFHAKEVITCNSTLAIRDMVAANLGISLLGKSSIGNGLSEVSPNALGIQTILHSVPIGLIGTHPLKLQLADILRKTLIRDFL